MIVPRVVVVENKIFLNVDELLNNKQYDLFFSMNRKTPYKTIAKHSVSNINYRFRSTGGELSSEYKKGRKLYLYENGVKDVINSIDKAKCVSGKIKQDELDKKRFEKHNPENIITLPNIVNVPDDDKFQNDDGNIIHIEMRGEKTEKGLYFKALDVEKGFGVDRMDIHLLDVTSGHIRGIHYEVFMNPNSASPSESLSDNAASPNTISQSRETKRDMLYLTFEGLLKLVYCSTKNNMSNFRSWVSRTIFGMQMGSIHMREEIAADAMQMNLNEMRLLLSTFGNDLSGLYLFKIGNVETLAYAYNLDQTKFNWSDGIYKFGKTQNIDQRYLQHIKKYSNKKQQVKHQLFRLIDPAFLSTAETELIHFFKLTKVLITPDNAYKDSELVVISDNDMINVKKVFDKLCESYKGKNAVLINKIESLEQELYSTKDSHQTEVSYIKQAKQTELDAKHEIIHMKDEMIASERQKVSIQQSLIDTLKYIVGK